MPEYKVLTDNSALKRKLEKENNASDVHLADMLVIEHEPDVGERRMMFDFGLTQSELLSGLAGVSIDDWVIMAAEAAGIEHPTSNLSVMRHLVWIKQLNADAHNVAFGDYDATVVSIVKSRLQRLWGSHMTGEEYLLQAADNTMMDWSSEVNRHARRPTLYAPKTLAPNTPSDNIFDMADDTGENSYAAYREKRRRERLKLMLEPDDDDELIDDELVDDE